jgi:hypothetical protein
LEVSQPGHRIFRSAPVKQRLAVSPR